MLRHWQSPKCCKVLKLLISSCIFVDPHSAWRLKRTETRWIQYAVVSSVHMLGLTHTRWIQYPIVSSVLMPGLAHTKWIQYPIIFSIHMHIQVST